MLRIRSQLVRGLHRERSVLGLFTRKSLSLSKEVQLSLGVHHLSTLHDFQVSVSVIDRMPCQCCVEHLKNINSVHESQELRVEGHTVEDEIIMETLLRNVYRMYFMVFA